MTPAPSRSVPFRGRSVETARNALSSTVPCSVLPYRGARNAERATPRNEQLTLQYEHPTSDPLTDFLNYRATAKPYNPHHAPIPY
jgi:hypothetical protein